jgi:hypothetical protein
MKLKHLFVVAPAFFMLYSCGSGENNQNTSTEVVSLDDEMEVEQAREVSIVFPSAIEIMTVFKNAGLNYQKGITNPASNADKYNSKLQKAIGIGIFTSDLAYCVINGQNQAAVDYMKTVISMSEKLGISAVKDAEDLSKRFSAALGDDEKTLQILTEVQQQTDMFIDENDLSGTATLIFSGAWLEGMFLAIKANEGFDREALSNRLTEQMDVLANLLTALEDSDFKGEEYDNYLSKLKDLDATFNALESVKNSGDEAIRLSIVDFKTIADKIVALRNEFI